MFASGPVLAPVSVPLQALPAFQALDGYFQVVALNVLLECQAGFPVHPRAVTGGNLYAPAVAVLVGAGLVRRVSGGRVVLVP